MKQTYRARDKWLWLNRQMRADGLSPKSEILTSLTFQAPTNLFTLPRKIVAEYVVAEGVLSQVSSTVSVVGGHATSRAADVLCCVDKNL